MNYFAFFPALLNEASNPNAASTGFFANPAGPTGAQHAALGGQGISIVSYSDKQEEAFKFLEWFIQARTNVLTIAMDSGFNSKSAFYTAFRHHTTMTPIEYRRINSS